MLELKSIGLDLTSRCNETCSFCPFHGTHGVIHSDVEMPLSVYKMLARDLATITPKPVIKIAGSGEPTIYRYFNEAITHFFTMGFSVRLITNGTTISKKLDILKPLTQLVISLHGTEKVHDSLTGRPGSYKKVLNGLTKFRQVSDAEIILNMVITDQNYTEIETHAAIAISLGAIPRFQHMKFTPGNSALSPMDLNRLWELKHSVDKTCPVAIWEPEMNQEDMRHYYDTSRQFILNPHQCWRIYSDLPVRYDGEVFDCRGESIGNIKNQSILDIAFSSQREKFIAEVTLLANSPAGLPNYCSRCCYNSKTHITRYQASGANDSG